jgi:hypothetical protein
MSKKSLVVCFGDSYTTGWVSPGSEFFPYAAQLKLGKDEEGVELKL